MMNGTVLPWSVVVEATSPGGFAGSYGLKPPLVDLYLNSYLTGSLHWSSCAVAWHFHGFTCGPERTGPPSGWFVIVIAAPRPDGSSACSVFVPSWRPVTRPSKRPFSRTAKAVVMSESPSFTRMSAGFTVSP